MPLKPPRLSGALLNAVRAAAEAPGLGDAVFHVMRRSLRVDLLDAAPADARRDLPLDARPVQARKTRTLDGRSKLREAPKTAVEGSRETGALPAAAGAWPVKSAAYVQRFRDGSASPVDVAERAFAALEALAARKPTMNVVASLRREDAMREAEAARRRYAAGTPAGPLDGVPLLVKDEHDVQGLPTRLGSRAPSDAGEAPAAKDATLVARLRAAGAIVLGKSVMTEWGLSPLGQNVQTVMPHNPFDASRAAGGSSTGSGVAVAMGIGPLATGGDAGGSVRIPAALTGIFGLKPTFGRVSRAGGHFEGSSAHSGVLACSTADLALFLDRVATEHDPADRLTAMAPPPPAGGFGTWLDAGIDGLRVGVVEAEWEAAEPGVARVARQGLAALERAGAKLVPVEIPLAPLAAPIGYVTFGLELLTQVWDIYQSDRSRIGQDVRLALAALSRLDAAAYLRAQRLRAALRDECAAALANVDVIAGPTTSITAPRYTEADAKSSFSDPRALDAVCRHVFLANLTGLPAGTAPIGFDEAGLPIGLQITGDAWDEATVLACLAELERSGASGVRRPPGAFDLLGG